MRNTVGRGRRREDGRWTRPVCGVRELAPAFARNAKASRIRGLPRKMAKTPIKKPVPPENSAKQANQNDGARGGTRTPTPLGICPSNIRVCHSTTRADKTGRTLYDYALGWQAYSTPIWAKLRLLRISLAENAFLGEYVCLLRTFASRK